MTLQYPMKIFWRAPLVTIEYDLCLAAIELHKTKQEFLNSPEAC